MLKIKHFTLTLLIITAGCGGEKVVKKVRQPAKPKPQKHQPLNVDVMFGFNLFILAEKKWSLSGSAVISYQNQKARVLVTDTLMGEELVKLAEVKNTVYALVEKSQECYEFDVPDGFLKGVYLFFRNGSLETNNFKDVSFKFDENGKVKTADFKIENGENVHLEITRRYDNGSPKRIEIKSDRAEGTLDIYEEVEPEVLSGPDWMFFESMNTKRIRFSELLKHLKEIANEN